MPGKNKPKRLDRQRSWRVARRKKQQKELIKGTSRSRGKRPKDKVAARLAKKKPAAAKKVEKKVEKKVIKKAVKKE